MKETYRVNCYDGICMNWDAEEFQIALKAVQDFKAEKRNAERAAEIGHNIQKEILDLEELGFNLYYGLVHVIDIENLRVVPN